MKTNHRDGTRNKRGPPSNGSINKNLKAEARCRRRVADRRLRDAVRFGDLDAVAPTRNREVSDPYNWD